MSDITKAWTSLVVGNLIVLAIAVWIFDSGPARSAIAATALGFNASMLWRLRAMYRQRRNGPTADG